MERKTCELFQLNKNTICNLVYSIEIIFLTFKLINNRNVTVMKYGFRSIII